MNRHRYAISKVVYIFLLWLSLPIDIAFGYALNEILTGLIGGVGTLITLGVVSGLLGAGSYLLYLWQIEFNVKK
jgi:hypothetical protein